MNDFIKLPRLLSIIAFIIMSLVLLTAMALYFMINLTFFQDFLITQTDNLAVTTQALKDVLLPFSIIIAVPWFLNLLGILYLKRHILASAIMLIVSGLMMLYTIILPLLLVTAGTMLIIRYRHYTKNEKYQTPYQ
ncbi:hypothetical protein ERX37_06500 [Macrococcus hajekii]|uniref:DUF4064 domain-containing protein n=1 Tax=Macrococcus hajekii TaxID=198482 RepID=A0A4R6BJR6_9STAP|nr:hypothetical protein [Macrococcus hajekii]TDM01856.1 hypothetical protein ERX37_06500 [Macrococcus hajekii]GGB08030.1 hypothetical protein GCM10007190_15010 [Macrococcus hajekii]